MALARYIFFKAIYLSFLKVLLGLLHTKGNFSKLESLVKIGFILSKAKAEPYWLFQDLIQQKKNNCEINLSFSWINTLILSFKIINPTVIL